MKDIPGFESLYYINKNGEVFSYDRMRSNNRFHKGRELAQKKDKDGYVVLILTDSERYLRQYRKMLPNESVAPLPKEYRI